MRTRLNAGLSLSNTWLNNVISALYSKKNDQVNESENQNDYLSKSIPCNTKLFLEQNGVSKHMFV